MEIHFRRLLFQAGEREHKMNNKKLNSKNKQTKTTTVPPRPKKETTKSKERNPKDKKKKKCGTPTKKNGEKKNAKYWKTSNR